MDQINLHKVDANLKSWAKTTNNFNLLGRLVAVASDAHAADVCYHHQCYVRLRDFARAVERRYSAGPSPPPFDALLIGAQFIALIEHSDTTIFKLSELRKMYQMLSL